MTSLLKIIVTSVLSLLLFSCNFQLNFTNELEGKGPVTSQEHKLQPFNQVDVSNSWNVVLIEGSQPQMTVTANENLHENLEFSVNNGILNITSKNNIGYADAKTITVIYVGELQKVSAHSGSEISSNEIFKQQKIDLDASSGADISLAINTQAVTIDASSGADIKLSGTTENLVADASSGSEIDANNLKTKSAKVDASSGGEISIYVSENIIAEASSGGDVTYFGNPKNAHIDNSVSGSVTKK